MKSFHCDHCHLMVFFQNDRCVKCDHQLGFLPDVLTLVTLESAAENLWQTRSPLAAGRLYRQCDNGRQFKICNWMVPENDSNPLCVACRLNQTIPNLADEKNQQRWAKLELAKRRCIYTFLQLGLPLEGEGDAPALRFCFLQDTESAPVKTGHQDGVITINIAEADDDEREHRRLSLHEPYRTLVGHVRHESGHYYWDRLMAKSPALKSFRKLFGDETVDYVAALKSYYQNGAASDWQVAHVTPYASSHPWEDWAETWAHYLHLVDTLETAGSFGVGVNHDNAAKPVSPIPMPVIFGDQADFERMLEVWLPLTCALNSLNQGMGLSDLYPFVTPAPVIGKLRFIHEIVTRTVLKSQTDEAIS